MMTDDANKKPAWAWTRIAWPGGVVLERVVLPSRIRRGRQATSPVWRVTLPTGYVWQFGRKRDAEAFAKAGGCHNHDRLLCHCGGYVVSWPDGEDRR